MEKRELLELIDVAVELVDSPGSAEFVAFSGHSLGHVLRSLEAEVRAREDLSADQILMQWKDNVSKYREAMFDNAKKDEAFVDGPLGKLLLLREDDAQAGNDSCQKGAGGYSRPRIR